MWPTILPTMLPVLLSGVVVASTARAALRQAEPARGQSLLHPHLVHNATLLAKTWTLLQHPDTAAPLGGAIARVEAEARGHLQAGPFSIVTSSGTLPPSGDRHDYTSVGVYWWPCAVVGNEHGDGDCDVASCVHSGCNCSSVDVCGKRGPACNNTTGLPWQSCDGHENRKQIARGGLGPLGSMGFAVRRQRTV